MVKRCAWGTCNADVRYPERLQGGRLILFPKPRWDLSKCKRWIKACGRPHHQLNIDKIDKNRAVCSKHFIGGNGPTKEYPDPIPADGTECTPARKRPRERCMNIRANKIMRLTSVFEDNETDKSYRQRTSCDDMNPGSVSTQTEDRWIEAMDVLALAAENKLLKCQLEETECKLRQANRELLNKERIIKKLTKETKRKASFGVEQVMIKEKSIKNLFRYYTGITYLRFVGLMTFLLPGSDMMDYGTGRGDIKKLPDFDGLFMTICRLRHAFGLKDLATRFGLSSQSAGIVFDKWIDLMYTKLGQLPLWPHRDDIIKNMPQEYKSDFPTSLIIIDGTELKTQTPCSLGLQSQLYSDYKSSTTLKGLIGCDPNGSLLFISELYTGSISDKVLTERSGFYKLLKNLKQIGYIQDGDAVMADKGFNIETELKNIGLKLNIPPFTSATQQMTYSETNMTSKIAKHRIHVERLIRKVKTYTILSTCIPTSLFKNINKIWSVCGCMTLFQDVFVKDRDSP